jgi:hypothetical protein
MANPAIEFVKVGDEMHLIYRPRDGSAWVADRFRKGETLILKGTFHLTQEDLVNDTGFDFETTYEGDVEQVLNADVYDDELTFRVAHAVGEYFHFNPAVLPVGVPVLLAKTVQPTWKWFCAEKRASILDIMAKLKPSRIVLGGGADDAIPIAAFLRMVEQFPTPYELKRYVQARVASVVRQYTDAPVDAEAILNRYVSNRLTAEPSNLASDLREIEVVKFELVRDRLVALLESEDVISEHNWQTEILGIIRLLNPKYIAAFMSVEIKDSLTGGRRQLDILLVDASGHIDVIEIKKPFGRAVMSEAVYRDNHVPLRELSGSVMQIEKYIYHLSRWGREGENELTRRYTAQLPPQLEIRITNPCGIVIVGRDNDLSDPQRQDFEVFRRQNKNIVDVMTYDDLLRRLDVVLEQLRAHR